MNNAVKLVRMKYTDDTIVLINIFHIKAVYDNGNHRTVEFADGSLTDVNNTIDDIATIVSRSF